MTCTVSHTCFLRRSPGVLEGGAWTASSRLTREETDQVPKITHPHQSRYPQIQRPREEGSIQRGLGSCSRARGESVSRLHMCVSVMPLIDPRVKMVLFVDFLQPLVTVSSLYPSSCLSPGKCSLICGVDKGQVVGDEVCC